jgi:integrase
MAGHRNALRGHGAKRLRKGTVAVHSFKGVLRLIWSYLGKRYCLYCGLADTPLNRIVAEGKAKVREGDFATGNFDPTLAKYKPERQNQISAVQLFKCFMERRSKPQVLNLNNPT